MHQKVTKNAKSFKEIPDDTLFVKFVTQICVFMMRCNVIFCQERKVKRWYNENSGNAEKDFAFRFRGKESFLYMKHFSGLFDMIVDNVTNEDKKLRALQVYYQSVKIRKLFL